MDDNTLISQINSLRDELDRLSYSIQQQIDILHSQINNLRS
jgi:flagellar hook-associated protein FlgK